MVIFCRSFKDTGYPSLNLKIFYSFNAAHDSITNMTIVFACVKNLSFKWTIQGYNHMKICSASR